MRKVFEALEDLGDDADLVASNLFANGCKGDQRCSTCPVAVYLRKRLGIVANVFPSKIVLNGSVVEPPKAVSSFIMWFDIDGYLDLYEGAK